MFVTSLVRRCYGFLRGFCEHPLDFQILSLLKKLEVSILLLRRATGLNLLLRARRFLLLLAKGSIRATGRAALSGGVDFDKVGVSYKVRS